MKKTEDQLIWESMHNTEESSEGSAINRVTCHCDDCGAWAEGNKCVADDIHLEFAQDDQGNTICECKTYKKAE